MICLKCNEFRVGFVGRLCPVCSEPLVLESNSNRDKLVLGRMREYLLSWQKSGVLSKKSVNEIETALDNNDLPLEKEELNYSFGILSIFVNWMQSVLTSFFLGLGAVFEPILQKPDTSKATVRRTGKEIDASFENLTEGILVEDNSYLSGVDALSEFDEKPKSKKNKSDKSNFKVRPREPELEIWTGLRPLFNEYIWWFIGTVLILTGSIMGIREAWNILSGVNRHLVVLGSLILYEFLFTSLGIFLSTKSLVTGRLLSIISILLLPVSFSVLSDVFLENPTVGVFAFAISILMTAGILSMIAKQFQISSKNFTFAILPSLFFQAVISILGVSIFSNLFLFIPLGVMSYFGRNFILDNSGSKGLFSLSIYGGLSVLAVFINQVYASSSSFNLGSLPLFLLFIWILGLSSILAISFGRFGLHTESRRLYVILEILFLAVTLVIASISGIYLFTSQTSQWNIDSIRIAYSFIPVFVSILFFDAIARHEMSLHLFMVLSICSFYFFGKEILPPTYWGIAMAPIVPITSMLYTKKLNTYRKISMQVWGVFSGIFFCMTLLFFISQIPFNSLTASEILKDSNLLIQLSSVLGLGFYFAFAVHRVAGFTNSIVHLAGVFGSFTFLYGLHLFFFSWIESIPRIIICLCSVSVLYHFASIPFEKNKISVENSDFQPMDDLSLATGILALFAFFFVSGFMSTLENCIIIAAGIILIIRSLRDNSSFSSLIGALLISISVFRQILNIIPDQSTSANAVASSLIAFSATFICIVFPNLNPIVIQSRKFLFVIRLPFAAQGPVIIRNALSATSLIYILYSISLVLLWLGISNQPQRDLVIFSGILLAFTFALGFFTRALNSFYLRGSVVSLSLIFISIGLSAVANRIGRPLPPIVVGQNLTLGILALWIFSRILFWKGQRIGEWLDNSNHGKYYHFIPLAAMALLGIVLFLDAWLLQPANIYRFLYITPPTFFIGASLAAFLFSRTLGNLVILQISFGLLIIAYTLIFSQQSLLGIQLTPLDLPGSRWVPLETVSITRNGDWTNPFLFLPESIGVATLIIRATTGIAIAGISFSILSLIIPITGYGLAFRKIIKSADDYYPLQSMMIIWSFVCTMILCLIAFQFAFIEPAVIAIFSSALLILSSHTKIGNLSFALSGILLIHGFAHTGNLYPSWTGPLFAILGFIMILSVKPISKFSKKPYSRILESSHAGAFLYSALAIIYSLATFSPARFDNAVPGLLLGFFSGLGGLWMQSLALGITLFFISLSLLMGSLQWTKTLTVLAAIGSYLLLGLSGVASFPVLCGYGICSGDNATLSLLIMIPYFSLILATVSALARIVSVSFKPIREDHSIGAGIGSDLLIVLCGTFLALFLRFDIKSSLVYNEYALLSSMLIVIVTSIYAAYNGRKPRHIYFSQVSIASLYLALKPSFPELLTPEVDAIMALIFGFILTGITTISRRVGIPPLEDSTRRFAAVMPVVAAIVLPTETSYQNAGMATFSSILYAALSITSSNRLYSVLAAVTGNLAIFTAIKASNMQGIEVYLAPLGLFTLFLGHIFKNNLTVQIIKIIRILGGLLLYLPAGINISFEIGQAANAMYSIYFGIFCLIGIAAGMLFQIRSYLFMGIMFFTLNLVANLLQSGLRDQRMGFILLSLAGLSIIASLVYYSIRKDKILGFVERTRKDLAKWD